MIDRSHALPVSRQAQAVGISRGSVYYLPKPTRAADLAIMRRIDELHLNYPFAGSRMLRDLLGAEGIRVWAASCRNPDEEDGDHSDLSSAQHVETSGRPKDLSLFVTQAADRQGKSGLGNRHNLHTDGARGSFI